MNLTRTKYDSLDFWNKFNESLSNLIMKKVGLMVLVIFSLTTLHISAQCRNQINKNGGGVCNSLATYLPQPVFSQEAIRYVNRSVVYVKVRIDKEGNVNSAEAHTESPLLNAQAVKAAYRAKFKVTKLSGEPVEVNCGIYYKIENVKVIPKKPNLGLVKLGKAVNLRKPNVSKSIQRKIGKTKYVLVEVEIDNTGRVISAKTIKGNKALYKASLKATKLSRFSPTLKGGILVNSIAVIKYEFSDEKKSNINVALESIKVEEPIILNHFPSGKLALFAPQPFYPEAARAINLSGKVVMQILVDIDGKVEKANIVSGHPLFHKSSIKAAKATIFPPQKLGRTPVKVRYNLVFNFKC